MGVSPNLDMVLAFEHLCWAVSKNNQSSNLCIPITGNWFNGSIAGLHPADGSSILSLPIKDEKVIKIDITKEIKYEECKDEDGEFVQLTYKKITIAEIRLCPGWIEGKKIKEVFKVFYCEDHPIDYVWINQDKKKSA